MKTTTQQHPINHSSNKPTTSKKMWRKEQRWKRKVELGRVGRKCKGHWVNGVEEEKSGREEKCGRKEEMITIAGWIYILAVSLQLAGAELLIWNYWSKPIKQLKSEELSKEKFIAANKDKYQIPISITMGAVLILLVKE